MNRKILYGYQIQGGELSTHPQEAENVKRIFALYLAGMSRQKIADDLNAQGIIYSAESPAWSINRILRATQNPRYMGKKGTRLLSAQSPPMRRRR